MDCFLYVSVNVGEDCPVFDGLFEFCQLSTGGSIGMWDIKLFTTKLSYSIFILIHKNLEL